MTQHLQQEEHLKTQLCDICHKMWQLGWVAANDGNVSVKLTEDTILCTPTGISKSFITPEKIIKIDMTGQILAAQEGYQPSSEIKMHLRCYQERPDVQSVVHAHPPVATGFALAHIPLDSYALIESSLTMGAVPITPFGMPSTNEVPEAIAPFLAEHDVLLLENHGALTVGSDLVTAYYRMESLELCAKTTYYARTLLGSAAKEAEIPAERMADLMAMREKYQISGRHPGYKKYS